MPLHLLGKKSWNVYNPANIARVRRDEEAARAREEAEEQRMQEADAARRLAILRGEISPPLDSPEPPEALPPPRSHDRDSHDRSRKRKRHGEDDTDFEMRIARERASANDRAARELAPKPSSLFPSQSLVDSKGHITLFSSPSPPSYSHPREANEDFTREKARKERELKDQYQMRFVNAGGGKYGQGLTDGGPWYAKADGEASAALVPSKDVWGREDPRRKVREAARLGASDPLAMMKRGAKMVRELERERKKEVEERGRELRELGKEERRKERKRKREEQREKERRRDDLDGDGGSERRERSHRSDRHHGSRERDRSREHEKDRREKRDSIGRRERSHRHHEKHGHHGERRRDRSRDRDRRREEHEHKNRHGRDDERASPLSETRPRQR